MFQLRKKLKNKKYDKSYSQNIDNIAAAVEKIHKDRMLYNFTDHGIAHSNKMINMLDKMIRQANLTSLFSGPEIFIMLAAIYLHDIGIQADEKNLLRSFAGEYSIELSESVLSNADSRHKFIRDNHHLISGYWIEQNAKGMSPREITVAYYGDPILGKIVANVVKAHNDIGRISTSDYDETSLESEKIRPRLLSTLLCLLDSLDCDRSRIDADKMTYTELPLLSRIHWKKHFYVKSVELCARNLIKIHYHFPSTVPETYKDTYIEFFQNETSYWIMKILNDYGNQLAEVGLTIRFSNVKPIFGWEINITLNDEEYRYIEGRVFENIISSPTRMAEYARTVIGVLKYEGNVLMVERRQPEANGLLRWQFPAGNVRAYETPGTTIIREVKHETGLSARIIRDLGARRHPDTNRLCYYYALEYESGELFNGDEHENASVEWVPLGDFQSYITSDIYESIMRYLVSEES